MGYNIYIYKMMFGDIFDEMDCENYPPGRYDTYLGSSRSMKKEKRFYYVYSALMQCHAIIRNGVMYKHTLNDLSLIHI